MKKILLLFTILVFVLSAFAVPARRQFFTNNQSDGTTIVVRLVGDEAFHYYVTMDNIPLVKEDNGDFSYAILDAEGNWVSTNCLAHNSGMRSYKEQAIIDANDFSNIQSDIRKSARRRSAIINQTRSTRSTKFEGVVNIPILLVEFADKKFSFSKDDIEPMFIAENYAGPYTPYLKKMGISSTKGSVRDYFVSQSDGIFQPNFVVMDIVTLDKNLSYYGKNNNSGNDSNVCQMIIDACRKLDSSVDFSMFDNDNNGVIELLHCVYAGYSEAARASSETIWPHQWYLSVGASSIKLDNVKIDAYSCSSELAFSEEVIAESGDAYANNLNGIGSCCHEFSHSLGLPDFYDTSDADIPAFGMDYWDVMDYGCYNVEGYVPIAYGAYERDFMGWRSLQEINEKGKYTMEAVTSGGVGYKVVNNANPNEYYIIENRQQEGWDKYIFNSGVLITHVDYSSTAWFDNEVNVEANHQRFTIIPADGERTSYYTASSSSEYRTGLKGDVWPGIAGNTALTNTSTPAAKVFKGGYMSKPITNIKCENGLASFLFMSTPIDAPKALEATDVTGNSFTANWTSVGDANEYIVTLEQITESENETKSHSLLFEDFIKCTSSNIAINTPDDYFSESGWSVVNCYGETGTLRVGSSNNKGTCEIPVIKEKGKFSLSFKNRLYRESDTDVQLSVFLKNNITKEETELLSVIPESNWVATEIVFEADSDFSLIFSTVNSTGNKRASIDDVELSLLSKESVSVVETVTTTDTNYKFTELSDGAKYRYSVKARDILEVESVRSNYIYVTLLSTSIDKIHNAENSIVTLYSLKGHLFYNGPRSLVPQQPSGVYIMRSGSSVEKIVIP